MRSSRTTVTYTLTHKLNTFQKYIYKTLFRSKRITRLTYIKMYNRRMGWIKMNAIHTHWKSLVLMWAQCNFVPATLHDYVRPEMLSIDFSLKCRLLILFYIRCFFLSSSFREVYVCFNAGDLTQIIGDCSNWSMHWKDAIVNRYTISICSKSRSLFSSSKSDAQFSVGLGFSFCSIFFVGIILIPNWWCSSKKKCNASLLSKTGSVSTGNHRFS